MTTPNPQDSNIKRCGRCKRDLTLDHFGLKQTRCKECALKYSREYRKNNPDKIYAATKKWRKKKRILYLQSTLEKLIGELNE